MAEGRINKLVDAHDHTVAAAWLGPMVDAGFVQAGDLDSAGRRVVMILSAPDRAEIDERLGNCRSCANTRSASPFTRSEGAPH
jgi:hypothetical protein